MSLHLLDQPLWEAVRLSCHRLARAAGPGKAVPSGTSIAVPIVLGMTVVMPAHGPVAQVVRAHA